MDNRLINITRFNVYIGNNKLVNLIPVPYSGAITKVKVEFYINITDEGIQHLGKNEVNKLYFTTSTNNDGQDKETLTPLPNMNEVSSTDFIKSEFNFFLQNIPNTELIDRLNISLGYIDGQDKNLLFQTTIPVSEGYYA